MFQGALALGCPLLLGGALLIHLPLPFSRSLSLGSTLLLLLTLLLCCLLPLGGALLIHLPLAFRRALPLGRALLLRGLIALLGALLLLRAARLL